MAAFRSMPKSGPFSYRAYIWAYQHQTQILCKINESTCVKYVGGAGPLRTYRPMPGQFKAWARVTKPSYSPRD